MNLRELPSVESLLQTKKAADLTSSFGRSLTLQAIREALAKFRERTKDGDLPFPINRTEYLDLAESILKVQTNPTLVAVINASGVILHTNLGRAPLSKAAQQAMIAVSKGYASLELDLLTGKRGSRLGNCESLFQRLCGVESATVINNNAAAVLLALAALANRKRVIVPRTQLIEIGGGFRIPEVMKQSGAKLVEIGTTNKIRLSDYAEALEEPTALVVHAHRSNFKISGFTEEPEWKDIVRLAHDRGVPCLDDLGSGALLDTGQFGLAHEPTVQESITAGSDLVCFSGDKLFGGPQAGIIMGKASLIAKISKHPLFRAVRVDKICLAGLIATTMHYLKDEAEQEIPVWQMISKKPEDLKLIAKKWQRKLGVGDVMNGLSTIGGGSLPEENLATYLLALQVKSPNRFMESLRRHKPPIIARTENERILIDPRTVLPEEEDLLLEGLMFTLEIQ